jgi:hypothetical protein
MADTDKNLISLPLELLYQIVDGLPPISVYKLCLTSKYFQSNICDNPYFWRSRVKHDLSGLVEEPFINDSWQETWKYVMESVVVRIPIYYGVYSFFKEIGMFMSQTKIPIENIPENSKFKFLRYIKQQIDEERFSRGHWLGTFFDSANVTIIGGYVNIFHHVRKKYQKDLIDRKIIHYNVMTGLYYQYFSASSFDFPSVDIENDWQIRNLTDDGIMDTIGIKIEKGRKYDVNEIDIKYIEKNLKNKKLMFCSLYDHRCKFYATIGHNVSIVVDEESFDIQGGPDIEEILNMDFVVPLVD